MGALLSSFVSSALGVGGVAAALEGRTEAPAACLRDCRAGPRAAGTPREMQLNRAAPAGAKRLMERVPTTPLGPLANITAIGEHVSAPFAVMKRVRAPCLMPMVKPL